jgi:hypothetical protein
MLGILRSYKANAFIDARKRAKKNKGFWYQPAECRES